MSDDARVEAEQQRFRSASGDPFRWGVYLRPDPPTCAAVTRATALLRAQYGLVSAGAFPPHATLVGSRHAPVPTTTMIAALDDALAGRTAVTVHNAGIRAMGTGFVYDVSRLEDDLTPNVALLDLAEVVDAAVVPLETPAPAPLDHPFVRDRFRAHLSLASHDLLRFPHLRPLVEGFLREIDLPAPNHFVADVVELYRTASDDWSGRWWESLTWEHIHSWRLTAPSERP